MTLHVIIRTGSTAMSLMRLLDWCQNDDSTPIAIVSFPTLICLNAEGQREELPIDLKDLIASVNAGAGANPDDDQQEPSPLAEQSITSLFSQAVKSHESGDWTKALQDFSEVLDLDSRHADAAFNIAAILQMLGKTRLAVYYTTKVRWRHHS